MAQDTPRLAYTVEQALDSGTFSSRNKLYAAIARGDLRSFRDGKRRMISADALQEYIARRERATAEGLAA
jgi:excisionase family DNA binding protein